MVSDFLGRLTDLKMIFIVEVLYNGMTKLIFRYSLAGNGVYSDLV